MLKYFLLALFPMNTGLDSNHKSFNNSKYYFNYLENNNWKMVNKCFCLNVLNNSQLYGQFITSNWFQKPIDLSKEYIFQIVSIENGTNNLSNKCDFKLTKNIFQECINRMNNNNSIQEKILLRNSGNEFVLNLREHIQNDKKIYLISLPEFILNIN